MVYSREAEWVRSEAENAPRVVGPVARTAQGTRYFGTSGQAEWPPKDNGERSIWPPIVLTAADWPPVGTGPITDADVEAAEAAVSALMPWSLSRGVTSPSELAALAERFANLTRERDELRAEVARLIAELNAAHEAGLTLRRANP